MTNMQSEKMAIKQVVVPDSHTLYSVPVVLEGANVRIDKFIASQFPDFSRTYFQHLIETDCVTINGAPVQKSSIMVRSDDLIQVRIPEEKPRSVVACTQDLGIKILFTHEHFYIMYKPAGVLMHPTSEACTEMTMVDWLMTNFPELQSIGQSDRPAIVHRLDRETSGLLVVPRSNYAHIKFGEMFRLRTIHKTYMAIVHGHPAQISSCDYAIGRHPFHRKKMTTFPHAAHYVASVSELQKEGSHKARHALTHFKVLEYFDKYALVEAKPVTGRTHQIRVHLTALSHPLLGDALYSSASPLIKRHALHAASLSFEFDGKPFQFSAELPADFQDALTFLRS